MEISAETSLISWLKNISGTMGFKNAQNQSGDNRLVLFHIILNTASAQWAPHLQRDINKQKKFPGGKSKMANVLRNHLMRANC